MFHTRSPNMTTKIVCLLWNVHNIAKNIFEYESGWQKLCKGTKGFCRKGCTWTKILSTNISYCSSMMEFVRKPSVETLLLCIPTFSGHRDNEYENIAKGTGGLRVEFLSQVLTHILIKFHLSPRILTSRLTETSKISAQVKSLFRWLRVLIYWQ